MAGVVVAHKRPRGRPRKYPVAEPFAPGGKGRSGRMTLRASEIVRPMIGGAMSEHAFRSRRVTTTADLQRAMREQRTTLSRRKTLRRFSRVTKQCADNISVVLSCLRTRDARG